jgi:hypothetical protein
MEDVRDSFFYTERPPSVHPRQVEVVEYLFLKRPRDMRFMGDPAGEMESKWSECTKRSVFLPLFDPRSEMYRMYQTKAQFLSDFYSMEDVELRHPPRVATMAKTLTAPKPEVTFGSCLDGNQYINPVYKDEPRSIYSLDVERILSLFSFSEFSDISSGAIGDKFCFPTFTIERKSDSGSCFFAENELIGTLRCMLEAQIIANRRVSSSLLVVAMGLVNVGNWIEFGGVWPSEDDQVPFSFIH